MCTLPPGRVSTAVAHRAVEELWYFIEGRGQVWMTATEAALFDGIADASRFHIEPGRVTAA